MSDFARRLSLALQFNKRGIEKDSPVDRALPDGLKSALDLDKPFVEPGSAASRMLGLRDEDFDPELRTPGSTPGQSLLDWTRAHSGGDDSVDTGPAAITKTLYADARPKPASRSRVSVSQVDAGEMPRAFTSLANSAPLSPDVVAYVKGRMQPAAAQGVGGSGNAGVEADPLTEAQNAAARNRMVTGLARAASQAGSAIAGRKADLSGFDQLQEQADQPVRDLMTKRAAAGQDLEQEKNRLGLSQERIAMARAAEENDPNSGASKSLGAFIGSVSPAMGAKVQGMPAAQIRQALPVLTKLWEQQAEGDRELARLGAQAHEGNLNRANQRTLKQMEMTGELAKARAMHEPKPVPEQEVMKVVNQAAAPSAVDKLEQLQKDVGPSGLLAPLGIHVGAEGRYHDATNNLSGAIAAGALPAARETPGLMEEFKKAFPKGYNDEDRAKASFDMLRGTIKNNATGQIAAMKAGGYNPAQVQELQRQLTAPSSAAVPTGRRVRMPNGMVFEELSDGSARPAQ